MKEFLPAAFVLLALASFVLAAQSCSTYAGTETFHVPGAASSLYYYSTDFTFRYGTALLRNNIGTTGTECVGTFTVKSYSHSPQCGYNTWGRDSTSGYIICPTAPCTGILYPPGTSSPNIQWISNSQYDELVAFEDYGTQLSFTPTEWDKGMYYGWNRRTETAFGNAKMGVMCYGNLTTFVSVNGGAWSKINSSTMPVGTGGMSTSYSINTPGRYAFKTDLTIGKCSGWGHGYTTTGLNNYHAYYDLAGSTKLVNYVAQGSQVVVTVVDATSTPSLSLSGGSFSPSSFSCGQPATASFSFTITNTGLLDATITSLSLSSSPAGFAFTSISTNPPLPFTVPAGGSVVVTGSATATPPAPTTPTTYSITATLGWRGQTNPCTNSQATGSASGTLGQTSVPQCACPSPCPPGCTQSPPPDCSCSCPLPPNCTLTASPNPTTGTTMLTAVFNNMGTTTHNYYLDCEDGTGDDYSASNALNTFTWSNPCTYAVNGTYVARARSTSPETNCTTTVFVNTTGFPSCILTVAPNPTTSTATATATYDNLGGGTHSLWIDCDAATPPVNYTLDTTANSYVFARDCYYGASGNYLVDAGSTNPLTDCPAQLLTVNWRPPACTLSASPSSLQGGGTSTLTASFTDMGLGPHDVAIDCDGDGSAEFTGTFDGSNFAAQANCTYASPSSPTNITANASGQSILGLVVCSANLSLEPGPHLRIIESISPPFVIEGQPTNITITGMVQYFNPVTGSYEPAAGALVSIEVISESTGAVVYRADGIIVRSDGTFTHTIPDTEVAAWGAGSYVIRKSVVYPQCPLCPGSEDEERFEVRPPQLGPKGCKVIYGAFNDTAFIITVKYFGFSEAPTPSGVVVDCGNGRQAFPETCDGRTPDGRCAGAICDYQNIGPTYTLTATLRTARDSAICSTLASHCEGFI
ncbi:MAG: hypothetical protein QXG98_05810 [Candidatus Micrarchaeia archaeon]